MPVDEQMVDVSSDWFAACEVRQRFMRGVPAIDVVDISAHCRQVRELGGDFYDFVPAASGRVAFAIGDASGKGFAAALMIANVQSSLRTATLFAGEDGAEAIGAVNRQLYASSLANRYATGFEERWLRLAEQAQERSSAKSSPPWMSSHKNRSRTTRPCLPCACDKLGGHDPT